MASCAEKPHISINTGTIIPPPPVPVGAESAVLMKVIISSNTSMDPKSSNKDLWAQMRPAEPELVQRWNELRAMHCILEEHAVHVPLTQIIEGGQPLLPTQAWFRVCSICLE
jgi:hypothetical protein